MTSLLLIERGGEWGTELAKRFDLRLAATGKQALTMAPDCCELVILDSVSLRTPGVRLARQLKVHFKDLPLLHIALEAPKDEGANPADSVLTTATLTSRKLTNAVMRLLANTTQANELVEYGPFAVDLQRRLLLVKGHEMTLTPKLARLLEVFMRNPGETIDRRRLMEAVWHTDYVGDTRTLDVHIRWIRRAIEHDPSSPQYLVTVRGVGYRLTTPPMGLLMPMVHEEG